VAQSYDLEVTRKLSIANAYYQPKIKSAEFNKHKSVYLRMAQWIVTTCTQNPMVNIKSSEMT